MANLTLSGGRELEAKLLKIPIEIRQKHLSKMLRTSMQPMLDEARRLVPVKSGMLKSSLKITTMIKDASGFEAFISTGKAWYAHFIEFGTGEHGPLKDVPLKFRKGNEWVVAYRVGGQRPQKFLTRAFNAKKSEVLEKLSNEIKRVLNKLK